MKRTVALAILVALVLPPAAAPAQAQPRPAKARRASQVADAHLADGLARYEAGDFAAAVAAFEAGYAAEPRPAFLFAAAQAERRAGNCGRAIAYYDRFLATGPSESQAEAAREQRERCAAAIAPVTSTPTDTDEPAADGSSGNRTRPWYADPVADGLIVTSAALTLTGVAFGLSASSAADEANRAETYAAHDDAASRAADRRTFAILAFAGAAAVGGLAAWRLVSRPGRRERAPVASVIVGPGVASGVGIGVTGRF